MIDVVTKYAEKALADKTMGQEHLAACMRHMVDLDRQNTDDLPFVWDPARADHVLNFASELVLAEGSEPQPLVLMPHQQFDIGSLFGWVHADTGYRRFRRSYISMARQNGKTMFNGVLGAYLSGFSGYQHGKLFTVATKRRQARLAWEETKKFIMSDPDLAEMYQIQDWKSVITCVPTGCTIEALSKEGGLDEGFRSIFTSMDEIHQMRDNSIYSNLYRGTGALEETLISMITTRARSTVSFGYEMDRFAVNVLQGTATAEDMYVDIYCADEEDDIYSDVALKKANPYQGSTEEGVERLRGFAEDAQAMGGAELAEYNCKTINRWYASSDRAYVDIEALHESSCETTLADMAGRECYVGVDLSSGGDLTSIAFDFPLGDGDSFVESHSFMPRGRFEEHIKTDLAPYDVWEKQDLLTLTGGSDSYITDHIEVWNWLAAVVSNYDLRLQGIAYDPHGISTSLVYLEDFGVPLMKVTQSARALNDATLDIQLKIKSKKMWYNSNNGLLIWSFSNAETVHNSFGEIKIDKVSGRRQARIDPVDALINARAMQLANSDNVDLNAKILSEDWSL